MAGGRDGRAAYVRIGDGDLDKQAAASADEEDQGGRASKSGQRLGNIAVVLPPPWLRDVLSKYDKITRMKYYPSNL